MLALSPKIPLARLLLFHNKRRLSLSLLGVAMAVVIMSLQLGFYNGFGDSQTNLTRMLKADLVMISKTKKNMMMAMRAAILQAQLYQVLANDAVAEVIPIYEDSLRLKTPGEEMVKAISIIAFPIESMALEIEGLQGFTSEMKKQGSVLFDKKSRGIYGRIEAGMEIELSGQFFRVAGLVAIGANFSRNGYIIMDDATLLNHPHTTPPYQISYGVIRAKDGTDISRLKAELQRLEPDSLQIITPRELQQRDRRFFARKTPVGILFGAGLTLGFVIGIMICYQILFNDISDNLVQYATLVAIGFSRFYLTRLVVRIAMVLSVCGFAAGFAASWGIYTAIEHHASIAMFFTMKRIVVIFGLTVCMCVVSAFIAVSDLFKTKPAELF